MAKSRRQIAFSYAFLPMDYIENEIILQDHIARKKSSLFTKKYNICIILLSKVMTKFLLNNQAYSGNVIIADAHKGVKCYVLMLCTAPPLI